MQIQTSPFGSYTSFDPAANGCGQFKLSVSYSHPAILRWTVYQAQHTFPIGYRTFIRFWDDAAVDPDGVAFSASNPIFEGFVEEIEPVDSLRLEYAAYDPSYRAGKEIEIMSFPWPQGTVDTVPPVPASNAVPRLIMNATIDNDDDWAFQRGGGGYTVGNIVATILADQYHPLYWMNAAPGDGSSAGNGTAYTSSQLNAMTYVPQEKMVFQSETLRSAFDRLVGSHYPSRRMVWTPGTRKWSFVDLTAATARTITLNQYDGSNDVLSMELRRSIERRSTAVKFYGPETLTLTVASTQDGSLVPVGYPTTYETIGVGTAIRGYQSWQVTNPNRRRMGRLLPERILVPSGGWFWVVSRAPSLQASWDNGQTWVGIRGAYFDHYNGIASIAPSHLFYWSSQGVVVQTGTQHYFPPTHVRLVYAFYDTPLSVRYPTSGFSGTAYDIGNVAHELKIYDEMLAIGYERGVPVTSVQRLSQYSTLAQELHKEGKDILYVGGMTFDGIEYDWCRLNRRVHVAGVDEDGNSVVTGWESIGAWVTEAEYDFNERITTIQFNSDQAELMGLDVAEMKERLGIRALTRRRWVDARLLFYPFRTWYGDIVWAISGITSQENVVYVDPETGEVHNPIH